MERVKLFEEFINESNYVFGKQELTPELLDFVSEKLNIKIGKFIAAGQQGEIYQLPNNKILKLTSFEVNELVSNYLMKNPIKGTPKIYKVIKVKVPNELADPVFNNSDTSSNMFGSSKFLTLGSMHFDENTYIVCVVREDIKPNKQLAADIEFLNTKVFKDIKNILSALFNIHVPPLDFLGLFSYLAAMLFEGKLKKFIKVIENPDLLELLEEYGANEKQISIFKDITSIMINLAKNGIIMMDYHSNQFGYNKKKKIVLFDIDNAGRGSMKMIPIKYIE